MVRLNISGKMVDDLNGVLQRFVNLRYLDLSNNLLDNIDDIVQLKYLIKVDAQNNLITSVDFIDKSTGDCDNKLKYLQV